MEKAVRMEGRFVVACSWGRTWWAWGVTANGHSFLLGGDGNDLKWDGCTILLRY